MYKTYNVITQPGLERKLQAYFVLFPKFYDTITNGIVSFEQLGSV